jgi:hypothetical protein
MGIFSFLFGKAQEKVTNEFWGEMTFTEGAGANKNGGFNCKKLFTPIGKQIDVYIDTNRNGLTDLQVDFYKLIEQRYVDIVKSVIPILEDEFGNWQEGFKIKNFEQEFPLLSMQLPDCTGRPVEWEIAFSSIHDDEHMFTVIMQDLTAKHVQIDG